ncbi:GNAT family N-acetyltransferase [Alteromonas sp. CYL-A6]|uniref:GNAT family N-acetyltransferase n=1 Tax=Alteromonas nitratireducens TaxID=3390813 RepID=UPI0034AC8D29
MKKPIDTTRLRLRPLTDDDAEWIYTLNHDPLWLRFIGSRGVATRDDALTYIGRIQAQLDEWGYGLLAVTDKHSGQPYGMCGLIKRPTMEPPDLGFALLAEARGAGIAKEAAGAVLAWATETGRFDRVTASAHAENHRSIALLKMLGFELIGKMFSRDVPEQRFFFYRCPR